MKFDRKMLSVRERTIFDALLQGEVGIDKLIEEVEIFEGKKVTRNSIIVNVKYLQAKIAEHGWTIRRTSPLGAKNKAIFLMRENS